MDRTQLSLGDGVPDLKTGSITARHPAGRRHRRRPGLLAAIALVALLVGTGPAALASQTRQAGAAAAPGDGAYLPASTVLFASFNPVIGGVQGKYLQGLEAIFESESGFNNVVKSVTGTKSTTCVNLNKQVLSWLAGSVTLALTSPSALNGASTSLPSIGTARNLVAKAQGVVVLLAIKPDMVQRQLPGILSQNHLGTAKRAGSYAGVTYYNLQITACGMKPSTSSPAFGAIVGTEGVVTPTVKDLQGEINVLQGKAKSLASTAAYQHLIGVLPPVGLGYLYVNTAALVQAGSGAASSLGAGGAAPTVSGLAKGFGPFGAVLLAQANGLQIESDQLLNAAPMKQGLAVTPNKGATMLPKGTMFYLSIGDFPGVVNAALSALKASASAQDAATYNQVGVMFAGVLKVLNGEFALGILPMSPKQATALSAGKIGALPLAALFGSSDPTAAGAVISSLLGLLGTSSTQGQAQTTLKSSPLANGGMAFTNAAGYGYATLQHWLVASTALKNVVASIQSVLGQPQNSLAASSQYQQAAAGLPKNSDATVYLDITALRTLIEGVSLGSMSKSDLAQYQQMRPLLLPMKALEAGTSLQDNGKTLRTDAFLLIGR